MMEINKQIEELQAKMKSLGNITKQLTDIQGKIQDPQIRSVISETLAEFQDGINKAQNGKVKDFSAILNKIQNLANGHENTGN